MGTLLLELTVNVMATSGDSTKSTHYKYPIVPGTAEWSKLKTHQDMISAVQIPQDILNKMTTDELATAVLENPMIIDIYAYYTTENGFMEGYEVLCDELNCLKELSNKTNATACLANKLNDLNTVIMQTNDSSDPESEDIQSMYMAGNRILQCMTTQDADT